MSDSDPAAPHSEKDIFLATLERENAEERERFLIQQCRGNEELLERVRALLRSSGETGHFLDGERLPGVEEEIGELANDIQRESRFMDELGHSIVRLGDYELLEKVGRGATGVVYRARQASLNREVAVKVILGSTWMTSAGRRRFRREAEAAANLQHRHIVPVYDIGHFEGHDYYSMTYFPGGTLGDHMGELHADRRQAVSLVAKVAHTMQVAHNRGIFHRDLKPDNILLGEGQEPHISDFGLAYDPRQGSGLTLTGQILGTPKYMAPEQVGDTGIAASAQTDIYSIGAMLFEVLAGRPVIQANSFMSALRILVEETPPRLRSVDPGIDRDLETIVAKCLEKNPADRYVSAGRLADDLEAWLDHRPISIVAQTPIGRTWKWIKRKPVHAGLLGSLLLLIASLGVGGPLVALQQATLRARAENARAEAEFAQAEAVAAAELAQRQASANRRLAYASNLRLVTTAAHMRSLPPIGAQTLLNALRPGAGEDDFRDWEWYYTFGQYNLPPIKFSREGRVNSLNFSPFGESFLLSNPTGTIMFDTLSRVSGRRFMDGDEHHYSAWSPDGETIVTLGKAGRVVFWNPQTAERIADLPEDAPARSISWGPVGLRLAALGTDNTIGIWSNADRPRRLREPMHPPVELERIAWSPNGRYLAGVGPSHDVFMWEVGRPDAPLEVYAGHSSPVSALAWMQSGDWLATGSESGAIRIWGVPGGRRVANIDDDIRGRITALAWHPDDPILLNAIENDEWLFLLDFALGSHNGLLEIGGIPSAAAWSAEAHSILAGNTEGNIGIWRHGLPAASQVLWTAEQPLASVHWSRHGMEIISRTDAGQITSLMAADGRELWSTTLPMDDPNLWAWNPYDRRVARILSHHHRRYLQITDPVENQSKARIDIGPIVPTAVAWSAPNEVLLLEADGSLFRVDTGPKPAVEPGWQADDDTAGAFNRISVSPDQRFALAWGERGEMRLVSTATGEPVPGFPDAGTADSRLEAQAWHPEGNHLATSYADGTISIWSIDAPGMVREFEGERGTASALAWHPDGNRLAAGGVDGRLFIWDWANGEPLLDLTGHEGDIRDLAWDRGGLRLASVDRAGALMVWDATAGVLLSREKAALGSSRDGR